jgi:hypothetical protein
MTAAGQYRRPVAQKRTASGSRREAACGPGPLELPSDRAFVLLLAAHAQPPRRVVGRVEHVMSGRVTHVTSLRGLMAFLTDVLRDGAPED